MLHLLVRLCAQQLTIMTKQEEIDARRAASAASIKPGWTPQSLTNWRPKKYKPTMEHLRAEALARNSCVPILRTAQCYVTWLATHGPSDSDEDGHASAASALVSMHTTGANGGTLSIKELGGKGRCR